jgi:LuxR family quorum-sensing system transcriptional regulator SolR
MTDKGFKTQSGNAAVCAVVVTVAAEAPAAHVAKGPLSAREVEILSLASHGKTAPEMAAVLAISERTVAFHINNIVEKLGASNKTHAVANALRHGLIE